MLHIWITVTGDSYSLSITQPESSALTGVSGHLTGMSTGHGLDDEFPSEEGAAAEDEAEGGAVDAPDAPDPEMAKAKDALLKAALKRREYKAKKAGKVNKEPSPPVSEQGTKTALTCFLLLYNWLHNQQSGFPMSYHTNRNIILQAECFTYIFIIGRLGTLSFACSE